VHSPQGDVHFSYDGVGGIEERVFVADDGAVFREMTRRHADGRPRDLTLVAPDTGLPETIGYRYDSARRPLEVTYADSYGAHSLFFSEEMDALGRPLEVSFGGAFTQSTTYAPTGRRLPRESSLMSPTAKRTVYGLEYDSLGRVLNQSEGKDGYARTTTHVYDTLGRLRSSAQSGTGGLWADYAQNLRYDPLGNRLESDYHLGGTGNVQIVPDVVDLDRICRINYGHGPFSDPSCNVRYDGKGAITAYPLDDGTQAELTYFPSGTPRSIRRDGEAHATFLHDASGMMGGLEVEDSNAGDSRVVRTYGLFERRRNDLGQTTVVRTIPGPNGGQVAQRMGGNGLSNPTFLWPFGNQRGMSATIDRDAIVQEVEYLPFGEAKSDGAQPGAVEYTDRQWNDGAWLADFGINVLGARLYDVKLGRFLSRDPLLIRRNANTAHPYAFAFNDPINLSDPNGMCPPCGETRRGRPGRPGPAGRARRPHRLGRVEGEIRQGRLTCDGSAQPVCRRRAFEGHPARCPPGGRRSRGVVGPVVRQHADGRARER
jgi:RHS repeat-associated protein